MKHRLAIALCVLLCGCGSESSPTVGPSPTPNPAPSPSPTPAPAPTSVALTGTVTVTNTSVRLDGATIRILDGPNAGRTATTSGGGTYRFDGLTPGNANLSATAATWDESRAGVFIDGTNTLSFTIRTISPFVKNGGGNDVFTKPLWVTRVAVHGYFGGSSSNFVLWCDTQLVVNEIIGSFGGRSQFYDGTHSVPSCREMRTEISNGVQWSVTEVR